MKNVLEVLFPRVRAKLLQLLFATPQEQRYVRELMNMSGFALHTVQDELRKMNAVGLVVTWSNGYHRFYRANPDHPLFEPLLRIVQSSEKLLVPTQSALRRPPSRHRARKRMQRRVRPLPKDWPGTWHLFSNRQPKLTA